jgi:hypothetical protein
MVKDYRKTNELHLMAEFILRKPLSSEWSIGDRCAVAGADRQ